MLVPLTRVTLSAALLLAAFSALLRAETFVVTTTADTGPGSLRQAILDSNASLGSTIAFSIGSGTQRIRPLSDLPTLSTATIDGTTQPGYSGSPLIEIDGSLLPQFSSGITIGPYINGPADTAVKALVINNCFRGIFAHASVTVTGSFIGTDVTGSIERPNAVGITISSNDRSVIGGNEVADRNVISGNNIGILVYRSATILGNFIGTNAAGTGALPNLNDGIEVQGSTEGPPNVVFIGGSMPGEGNLISGNGQYGIAVNGSNDVTIQGNRIGPSVSGGSLSGQLQRAGVVLYGSSRARIGGNGPGEGNVIAHHGFAAIGIAPVSSRNVISGNSIHSNAFGIDLNYELNQSGSRVTPNDPGDPDAGPNLLQNFPVLLPTTAAGGTTTIRGTLNSEPNGSYTLEFFSSAACNGSGHGEGQHYVGSTTVVTGPGGDAPFEASFPAPIALGRVVTATATDAFGNTSEFSACGGVAQRFHTLEGCRLIDTRGDAALEPHSTRTFSFPGICGVPIFAKSIAVNVTVIQPTAAGYLTLSAGDLPPTLVSTINFSADQIRANNAIVRLPVDGSCSIHVHNSSAGTTNFALDVSGYFE
jgi:hypothetical protein